MSGRGKLSGVLLVSLVSVAATGVVAQERRPAVQLAGGVFNIGKSPTQGQAGLELRTPLRWWRLDLAGGAGATDEGAFWGYLGLRKDLRAGERFILAPGFGVAFYEPGDGKKLGGSLQFRSAIDVGFVLTPRTRLGVTFSHLSNAGREELNPGANSLLLTYGVAFR